LVQKKDHRRDSEPPIVVSLKRDAAVGGGINGEAEGGVCGSVSREEQDEIYD
jgi:hypothetical protein